MVQSMDRWIKQQQKEKEFEDKVRGVMLRYGITFLEAKKLVEKGQKTLSSFTFR